MVTGKLVPGSAADEAKPKVDVGPTGLESFPAPS